MNYLETYLLKITSSGNPSLAAAVRKTADDIVPQYISDFSYQEHVTSLVFGDVQSGKTSHIFGLMCAAADEGFCNFLLLTTDNIVLQEQTQQRAQSDLLGFCICGETDHIKFTNNNNRKPCVIVLKKNSSVLRKWKDTIAASGLCIGNPLFIVDDEADAASLNTKVNQHDQSIINRTLEAIKYISSSSIYLEVTGTPQALLLQTEVSGWKPYFIYYFKPGDKYLGGNFFFGPDKPPQVKLTDIHEAEDIMKEDELPENKLKTAVISHLLTASYLLKTGNRVCNFLIHPGVKIDKHRQFAEKIGTYLNDILVYSEEDGVKQAFYTVYQDLQKTFPDISDFHNLFTDVISQLKNDNVKVLTLNSGSDYDDNTAYTVGNNIIVGGNTLGRGVTFPQLQTTYYCRTAKYPQADTMWQHARMFGYDREPGLVRLFLPPNLYKLFCEINATNNSIIAQIQKSSNNNNIKLFYPQGLRPTRKNVLDKTAISIYTGGVNYFPNEPNNKDISQLDQMLAQFGENCVYQISLKFAMQIISLIDTAPDDWNTTEFENILHSFFDEHPIRQARLIVRRNRDISHGTGTLLSPNDRLLGDSFADDLVITLYKITGTREKGWNGNQIWIPNIKLPGTYAYYSSI